VAKILYAREFEFGQRKVEIVIHRYKRSSCLSFRAWLCHYWKHPFAARQYYFRIMGFDFGIGFKWMSRKDKAMIKAMGLDKALGINCD
jgi:hypothetical protein